MSDVSKVALHAPQHVRHPRVTACSFWRLQWTSNNCYPKQAEDSETSPGKHWPPRLACGIACFAHQHLRLIPSQVPSSPGEGPGGPGEPVCTLGLRESETDLGHACKVKV